jgi:hypothetical protein
MNSTRFFRTIKLCFDIQNNTLGLLEQARDQWPPAGDILFVCNGKNDRIGSP